MSVAMLSRTSDGLRDFYGRGMNLQSDVYTLPADAEEHSRLTLQHRIWKLMLGGTGLYPPDVQDLLSLRHLLSPADGPTTSANGDNMAPPSILDLGSGSGIWAAEMAALHPNAKVVGLDLTEPKLHFVTGDLTKGLDQYAASFDVVHCRCVAGHVVDTAQLMREIAKVLKPGGLLLLGDANPHVQYPDGSSVPLANDPPNGSDAESSWMARWFSEVISRQFAAFLDPEHTGGEHLGWLIRHEPGLEYLCERAYFSPICLRFGEEDGSDGMAEKEKETGVDRAQQRELAGLMGQNMLNYLTASKPILLGGGLGEETVNEWLRRARAEIMERPASWCMKWNMAWATRRADSE